MQLDIRKRGDTAVLKIVGPVDTEGGRELSESFAKLVQDEILRPLQNFLAYTKVLSGKTDCGNTTPLAVPTIVHLNRGFINMMTSNRY